MAGRQRSAPGLRLGLTLALLPLAGAVLANGVGRAGIAVPEFVPSWLSGRSSETRTIEAIKASQWDLARSQARRWIVGEPNRAEALSRYAFASLNSSDAQAYETAFVLAGQLGWRDQATQRFWLQTAIASDDPALAMQRLDALMRMGISDAQVNEAMAWVLSSPAGRAQLAERVRELPDWRNSNLLQFASDSPETAAQRVAMIRSLRASGLALDCDRMAYAAYELFGKSLGELSYRLWSSTCASNRAPINNDLTRPLAMKPPSPFEWRALSSGTTATTMTGGNGEVSFAIRLTGGSTDDFAYQALVLPPGRYRLSWRQMAGSDGQPANVAALLNCFAAPARIQVGAVIPTAVGRFARDVTIPQGCPVQELKLRASASGMSLAASATVSEVAIAPAG